MIVVKQEALDDEEEADDHHAEESAVTAAERQQAQKRARNRDEADEAVTVKSIKTKSLSSPFQDDDQLRPLVKEFVADEGAIASAVGSHPSMHSPPTAVVKTESRHHSPSSATCVSSSDHSGIRSWPTRSSPNGHTSNSNSNNNNNNSNKSIRPEIIFSHRRASSSTVVGSISLDSSANGGSRTAAPLSTHPPGCGSSPDRHHPPHQNGSNKQQLNCSSSVAANPRVPSVILGQSGGVKTMVWTGHWADQQQQQQQQQPTPSRPRSVPNGLDVQQSSPLMMAVHHNIRPGAKQNNGRLEGSNVQDAASIRLSIDGLLSLAQSSSERRHGNVSRSSPLQVYV